jgi:hypothetical protein
MFELTDRELQRFGTFLVTLMKKKIKEKIYPYGNPGQRGKGNKFASGQLYNSLTATVIPAQNNKPSELVITYQDYFKYVNLGRKANKKKVPIPSLLQWIKIRGIKGKDKKGRQIKDLSLAFAIQTNIFRYGIRPANIYDKALDDFGNVLDDLPRNLPPTLRDEYQALINAVEEDVNLFIDRTIDKEIKTIELE